MAQARPQDNLYFWSSEVVFYIVIMDKIEHTDTCGFEYMAIQSEQVTVDTWGFE